MPVLRWLVAMCLSVWLAACVEQVPTAGQGARILTMGDSMMAWNSAADRSVSHVIEARLGEPVVDRSVKAARMLYALPVSGALGLNISRQYVAADWDWVIVNGGGNDLLLGCGCRACDDTLNRMIDGAGRSGAIPDLVQTARAGGARVIYVGYLRMPGSASPVARCAPVAARLEARLARMAARDRGVFFVPVGDLVPQGDTSFHDRDRIHPSAKGSAAIGARIADVIRAQE